MYYFTVLDSALCSSNLVCSLVSVGWDFLHDEFHHLLGVIPGLADKTPEASAMFKQHPAAFSQHLVKKTQYVMCLN